MKHLILLLTLMFVTVGASSSGPSARGDGWPWPWGSECPFPWTDIAGRWQIRSLEREKRYDDNILKFIVEDQSDSGTKLLAVEHYDENGDLYAEGQAISEGNGRVISAIMDPIDTAKRSYKVIVRSYTKNVERADSGQPTACAKSEIVMAVTVCSMNGKKCLVDSNYTLVKPKSPKH